MEWREGESVYASSGGPLLAGRPLGPLLPVLAGLACGTGGPREALVAARARGAGQAPVPHLALSNPRVLVLKRQSLEVASGEPEGLEVRPRRVAPACRRPLAGLWHRGYPKRHSLIRSFGHHES